MAASWVRNLSSLATEGRFVPPYSVIVIVKGTFWNCNSEFDGSAGELFCADIGGGEG